ncbi:MAG: sporulation protein YabP [Erysipelotrichales bacterium]|nr:sporulation protein YabP [Erysipelotrichales bacterium]
MENEQTRNLIVIRDRKTLDLEGITKLDSFDSKEFLLDTNLGYLHVTGSDLELGNMNMEKGLITIKGMIDSVHFMNKGKTSAGKENFFTKLFK